MKVNVIFGNEPKNTKPVEVSDAVFAVPYNEGLIHQVAVAYMAGARAGTRAQKTRAEVRGGGIKPWKQKGTGRARAGSIRSPLWRKGGMANAAKPQDHSQKVNRKMYRGAMRSIFAELLRAERMQVIEELTIKDNKTKTMIAFTQAMGVKDALIITIDPTDEQLLAARNLPFIDVIDVTMIDPVCLIGFANVIITREALQRIEETLA